MTALTKPVTRKIEIDGSIWNVTLDYAGVTFRAFRSREKSAITLPYAHALTRAAWIAGEKEDKPRRRSRRIKRGHAVRRER